jgi:hypothetical protein
LVEAPKVGAQDTRAYQIADIHAAQMRSALGANREQPDPTGASEECQQTTGKAIRAHRGGISQHSASRSGAPSHHGFDRSKRQAHRSIVHMVLKVESAADSAEKNDESLLNVVQVDLGIAPGSS